MIFQKGHIYHVYNQGNNRQNIFYNRENYLFFLEKMRTYLHPYADILAWCLMPNHFHWMLYINEIELRSEEVRMVSEGCTLSETLTAPDISESIIKDFPLKTRTLNDSIGILLRSYTRAINISQNLSGSLFRKETKAECVSCSDGVNASFFTTLEGTFIPIPNSEKEYPQVCFNYIHQNPVVAKLVTKAENWEFSSINELQRIGNTKMLNHERIKEFGLK